MEYFDSAGSGKVAWPLFFLPASILWHQLRWHTGLWAMSRLYSLAWQRCAIDPIALSYPCRTWLPRCDLESCFEILPEHASGEFNAWHLFGASYFLL